MERLFTCSVFQVKGLVLEHGSRYPDMKRQVEKCFILACNASLECEKRRSILLVNLNLIGIDARYKISKTM
jgi:hypothetical protein